MLQKLHIKIYIGHVVTTCLCIQSYCSCFVKVVILWVQMLYMIVNSTNDFIGRYKIITVQMNTAEVRVFFILHIYFNNDSSHYNTSKVIVTTA